MVLVKKIMVLMLLIVASMVAVNASQQQLSVEMSEFVDQRILYNPLKTGAGIWHDTSENQSLYNLTGYITVVNENTNGKAMSDIYIFFDHTTNITLPTLYEGRNGSWISNDTTSNVLLLHIPEIRPGENSTWIYSINASTINPVLNYSTTYSDYKLLAGKNITLTDTVINTFLNTSHQSDTCVYDINITQEALTIDLGGSPQLNLFIPSTTTGDDASNVTYSANNRTQYWDLWAGSCLNKSQMTNITYDIFTPYNVPETTFYNITNTTLRYKLNQTMSQLRVTDIRAISEVNLSFEKFIVAPSDPINFGSNVTWNVSADFNTQTNITYTLVEATLWVAKRSTNGDPNTFDNDTIGGNQLNITYNPMISVNSSNPWNNMGWLFNYSDLPTPIVWMDVNFTIAKDGTQLINRSISQNGNDFYIKELYLILGYWLEIEKNVTSLGGDNYTVRIDVFNKGNQVTPGNSIVTIYDFVPTNNFDIISNFSYSASPWYNVSNASNVVAGEYNGTLVRWALIADNILNSSLAAGASGVTVNNTWTVEYNVTGTGDYTLLDVFVTGLDPQQVDGAGSTQAVVVSEIIERIKSTEGVFAIVASVLLLLGLLL